MAVFSYVGGSVSMATGSYGNLAIRKGAQVAVPNTITTSLRSFTEGTPASGLFDPVDRVLSTGRVRHSSGFSANKLSFNTTEPYNNGAYSTSAYYTPYNTIFQDLDYSSYNTQSPTGEYWAHAYGFTNPEFGTAIAVDKSRNAWIVGTTDYCSATITSITASLTATASFTNNSTTPNTGTNDSGSFSFGTLPFNHNIFGLNSQSLTVLTNSWISFDAAINTTQTALTATSPGWANIQIGAGQASCQRVYWGTFGTAPTRTFRVRFEGTNATTGTLGSPNMVWEFILYESNPDIFDIQIGTWTPPAPSTSGITDGSNYFGTFTPAANTGWRFDTNVVGVAAGNNVTLVKYSTKGQFQRDKDFLVNANGTEDLTVYYIGRNGNDIGEAVKIGSDGRIYILYSSNSIGYQAGVALNDIGVIKVDPEYLYDSPTTSGPILWTKTFGTASTDTAASFDIDANDNLYITGFTQGSGQGSNDVIAIKVDREGRVVWKKTYGGTSGEIASAIRIDKDGNLFIWGNGATTPLVGTPNDFFILKVNGTTGSLIWQKHFNIGATTGATTFENSIDVDPFGNLYVNGYASSSPNAYFVAKLDTNGNFLWSRSVGAVTANPDAGTSVKYRNGFIYVSGQDSSTTTSGEGFGLGVSKINAITGQLVSNYVVGGVATEFAYAIDIDDYGDIYATGSVSTSMTGLTSATGQNAFTTKFILDTPQGGFSLSGHARVWSSTTGIKRYTSGKEYFDAQSIVFQNDLLLTGHQSIFGILPTTEKVFSISEALSGSGTLLTFNPDEQVLTNILTRSSLVSGKFEVFTQSQQLYRNISSNILLRDSQLVTISTTETNVTPGFRASARVTWNPADTTQLFDVSGTYSNFKFIKANSVSGSVTLSGTVVEKHNDVASGSGSASFSGSLVEKHIDTTSGSGSISPSNVNVTALVSFNGGVGASSTQLFTIGSGYTSTKTNFTYLKPNSNLIVRPENFLAAAWSIGGGQGFPTRTKDQIAPDESFTAWTLDDTSTGADGQGIDYDISITPSSTKTYCVSVFAKQGTAAKFDFYVFFTGVAVRGTRFSYTWANDTITTNGSDGGGADVISKGRYALPNGWYRFWFVVSDSTLGTNNILKYRLYPASRDTGPVGSTIFWGAKVEEGVAPSPYLAESGIQISENYITSSGNAGIKAPNRFIGSSPVEYYNAGQVAFGDGENFRASEIKADATALYRFQKGAFSATGSIAATNEGLNSRTVVAFIPLNTLLLFNTNVFTKLAMRYAGKSPTTPFGGLEIVFEELEANAPPQEFKYTGAASEPTRAFRWVATPSAITITGTAVEKSTDANAVSGSLTTGFEAGAKVTFRPFDATDSDPLFSINGQHGTRVFVPSWPASGTINITGAATQPPVNYVWVGASPTEYYNAGQIVFGEGENFRASEFKYDSTSLYRFQKGTFSGTGSKQISSAQNLFERSERFDILWGGFGLTSRSRVQNIEPPLGLTYVTKIVESLDGANNYHGVSRGSGITFVAGTTYTISIFAKAAERSQLIFGFDPPAFTANYEYGIFDLNSGTASAFIPAAGNPTVSIIPYPNGWYRCSVTKTCTTTSSSNAISFQIINNSSNFYTGDGTSGLYITGAQLDEHDSFSPYVLTDGAPVNRVTFKSVSFNPPDEAAGVQLFSISGAYSDLRSTSRNVITTAPLFTGGSASAVVSFNPPDTSAETQLFTVTGSLVEKYTKGLYTGDGYINSSDFGSAKVTFRPFDATDSDPLFSINGQHGTRVFVPAWIANGSISTTGSISNLSVSSSWVGSSPIEYYNPGQIVFGEGENFYASEFKYDSTSLYRFQKGTFSGTGSITADPNASAAVVFNPPDEAAGVQLFNVTGAYSDLKFIERIPADASPLIVFISGAASDEKQIDIASGSGSTSITGTLVEKQTEVASGSGTLFSASGAAEAFGVNPVDTTQLFDVSGSYSDLRSTFNSAPLGGTITISGAATEPPREIKYIGSSPTAYFNPDDIVFGNEEDGIPTEYRNTSTAFYRSQFVDSGSGSITTGNLGSAAVIFNPPDEAAGVQLFTISGTYSNLQFISQAGEAPVLFQISGAATQITSGYAWIGLSPFTYFSAGQIVFEEGENFGASEFKYDSTTSYRFQNATFSGSGSITTDPNSSATVSYNPPDEAAAVQLFTVSGQHGTRVFVPSWTGFGSTTLSGSGSQSIQYANFTGNSPSAYIDPYEVVFGEEENYGSTDISLSGYSRFSATPTTEVGSGALFSDGFFSNLKAIFRPFDATDSEQLFTINGQHGTKVFVPNWITTGTLSTGFEGSAKVIFNPPDEEAALQLFVVSGAAVDKHIDIASGSGNLFTASGGAEKVIFRPFDATDTDFLFSISGSAGVKLRDFVWVSPIVEYDPYEYVINDEYIIPDFIKFKTTFIWDNTNNIYRSLSSESVTFDRDVSGTATVAGNVGTRTFVPNWIGSGSVTITGAATEKHIDAASGSGNLFAASGASESVGANPPDDIQIFFVTGSATEKHVDISSGSGSATFSGTAVEKQTEVAIPGSGEALFGDGSATIQIIRYNVFGGLISFSQSATASVTYNPQEFDPLFTVTGSATQSETNITSGSGSIATDVSATSRVVFNPADTEQLFEVTGAYSNLKSTSAWVATGTITVTGTVVEKHIDTATGSGSAAFAGAATDSQTDITSGSGTYTFAGEANDLYIKGAEQFGGTLFIIDGGSARVTFNPPEGNQLFDVSGSFSDIKITSDYNATGSITIEGNVGSRVFVPNWIGSGTVTVTGESTQKHVDITSGSGALFTDGFYSNLKATFRSVSDVGLFDITGTVVEKHIDIASGSGSSTFVGAASESQTDITSGSGTLFSGGLYSNLRITFNPTEDPALFFIVGSASDKQLYKETGSGSVTLTGTLVEKHIDVASGSGSIAAGFNASASVTFRPFDATDTDSLFSILGSAIEKNTESYVGSGTATFSGTAAESQRNITSGSGALFTDGFFSNLKATFRPFDATDLDPLFSINGSAVEKNTESYVGTGSGVFTGDVVQKHIDIASGSGTLFSASGAAEAIGINPPDDTALFDISGEASLRYFARNIGSGSITTSLGGTASVTFNPPEFDPLFTINGTYSNLKFISANNVSGSTTFSGTVVEKHIDVASGSGSTTFSGTAAESQRNITSGSGSLFAASGAAESVGVNPPDDIALFTVSGTYSNLKFISANNVSGSATFSGTVVEKFTDAFVGSGTATFSGSASEKQTDITSGSGSLFTTSGASESIGTNPPDDIALFFVDGTYSNLKFTSDFAGSGTLFTVSGAAEKVTFNPPDDTQLFLVTGTSSQAQRNVALPGSGSLFTAFGGTASVTFNPPEFDPLFTINGTYSNFRFLSALVGSGSATFSGTVVEKFTSDNEVSGTATFSGTVSEKQTDITSGSGSLFAASGAAESVGVNPSDDTALFEISGTYSSLKSTIVYEGSGSLFTLSGAVIVTAISEVGTGLFDINDTADESITYKSIDGTGSLFGFGGGVESITFNPVDTTQLFEVSGQVSVTTSFGYGGGDLVLTGTGQAEFRRAIIPEQGSGEIVSSGNTTFSKVIAPFIGSGSLFAASGSAQATTNVPPIDPVIWEDDLRTTLYLASGSASVSRAVSIDNDVTINISGSGIVRTVLPERIFAAII